MQSLARNIGAAVLGWLTMAVAVTAFNLVAWAVLGPDGAFRSGSWEVSWIWSLGSIAIALLAAIAGGLVCSKIADGPWGLRFLIAIVVVLGVLVATGSLEMTGIEGAADADLGPRPDDVGMFEAMSTAQQPVWLTWLIPVLGVVGAILGSRLNRSAAE